MKNEQKEAYLEIITILNYMEIEYQEKVPKELISFFKRNSADNYKLDIDLNIPLKGQKLSNKTKILLAILDLNYWCKDEDEKQELIKKYAENEKRYQEELREKYNPDNIFKDHSEEKQTEKNVMQEQVALVKYKEPIFKKLFNKVKKFFHINS